MSRLRVLDIQTTGPRPPAEIIELGLTDVVVNRSGTRIDAPLSRLYAPWNGIPPEAKAKHHITEGDTASSTECYFPEAIREAVWEGDDPDVLVAHHCAFEQVFITESATQGLPWICTYKVALRLWPRAPGHSLQVLRYWLNLEPDWDLSMPPYRAGPAAFVTAHLLGRCLRHASVDQMIAWTQQPCVLPRIPLGKYPGMAWADAPDEFLQWIARDESLDPDIVWTAKSELAWRGLD